MHEIPTILDGALHFHRLSGHFLGGVSDSAAFRLRWNFCPVHSPIISSEQIVRPGQLPSDLAIRRSLPGFVVLVVSTLLLLYPGFPNLERGPLDQIRNSQITPASNRDISASSSKGITSHPGRQDLIANFSSLLKRTSEEEEDFQKHTCHGEISAYSGCAKVVREFELEDHVHHDNKQRLTSAPKIGSWSSAENLITVAVRDEDSVSDTRTRLNL